MGKANKIYIVPTGHGIAFILGVIVMVLTGATYGNNLIYLLAFVLFSIVLTVMVQTHNNLRKVSLQVIQVEDGFAGEWTRVDVKLSHKLKVERQNLVVRLKKNPWFLSESGSLDVLPPQGTGRVEVALKPLKRGVHRLPRWIVETRYPMGIFRAWMYVDIEDEIYVYPSLEGQKNLPRLRDVAQGTEALKSRQGHTQDTDFKEHRLYREGESYRRIDWKLVARGGEYYTKLFEGESGTVYRFDYMGLQDRDTEAKLSQLAIWIHEAFKKNMAFELVLPGKHVGAGNSPQHFRTSLRELSRFEGEV